MSDDMLFSVSFIFFIQWSGSFQFGFSRALVSDALFVHIKIRSSDCQFFSSFVIHSMVCSIATLSPPYEPQNFPAGALNLNSSIPSPDSAYTPAPPFLIANH